MAKPEASDAALELYEALDPAFTKGDEDRDWPALRLCIALVSGALDQVHEYVTDTDDGPGWQIIFDPQRCPTSALPYLAQFAGAKIRDDMSEAQIRAAIEEPEAFGRGTPAQIERVAKRRLTGSKTVILTERYTGNAWRLRVETVESETPEPGKTEAEITEEAKPIGVLLFFNTRAAWTWEEIEAEAGTYPTWTSIGEAFASWEELIAHEP
jgi:Phage tail protein (Tail_P2_I)